MTGMAIHLGPPVARRLMRPTRGLGSAPLPRRRLPIRELRPPIWPCSGWSLPVSLRPSACAAGRHRHCGTGPRLTAGGRYPPPCAAELGLSSRHPTGRPVVDAQPSDRLADPTILPAAHETSRATRRLSRPVDGPPMPGHPSRRGRWPRWPACRRRCSAPAARGSRTSGRTRRASRAPRSTAG